MVDAIAVDLRRCNSADSQNFDFIGLGVSNPTQAFENNINPPQPPPPRMFILIDGSYCPRCHASSQFQRFAIYRLFSRKYRLDVEICFLTNFELQKCIEQDNNITTTQRAKG
jgi:hypothetical protein